MGETLSLHLTANEKVHVFISVALCLGNLRAADTALAVFKNAGIQRLVIDMFNFNGQQSCRTYGQYRDIHQHTSTYTVHSKQVNPLLFLT